MEFNFQSIAILNVIPQRIFFNMIKSLKKCLEYKKIAQQN